MIDAREGQVDRNYGYHWARYASLGVKALIVSHSDGLDKIRWTEVAGTNSGMVSSVPINYVRAAASPTIFNYLGKHVRLRLRVEYENTPNRTLVGVLKADQPAREAVVIFSSYGASSILPDSAPGTLQAISPAVQLQVLKGLRSYRSSLKRDVIFISTGARFMAEEGSSNLIRILQINRTKGNLGEASGAIEAGIKLREQRRSKPLLDRREKNEKNLGWLRDISGAMVENDFLVNPDITSSMMDRFASPTRRFFLQEMRYLLDTIVLERSESLLAARIRFLREGEDIESEAFANYQRVRRRYHEAESASGFQIDRLIRSKPEFAGRYELRRRAAERFEELQTYHLGEVRRVAQELRLASLFSRYEDMAILEPRLFPAKGTTDRKEVMVIDTGSNNPEPESKIVFRLIVASRDRLGLSRDVEIPVPSRNQSLQVENNIGTVRLQSGRMWIDYGYAKYTFLNYQRRASYDHYADPVELPFMRRLETIEYSLATLGETILSFAHGNGTVEPVTPFDDGPLSFGGRVLATGIATSIVPDYPIKYAVVACRSRTNQQSFSYPGFYRHLIFMADPYGQFHIPHLSPEFFVFDDRGFSPVAVSFGRNGTIAFMKDEGDTAQRLFKSILLDKLEPQSRENVTIVTFRASPVAALDLINPQTLKDYAAVEMVSSEGLAAMEKFCRFRDADVDLSYLEPDRRVFVQLQAGAPGNEFIRQTRAFMLGPPQSLPEESEREIDGGGYLVADRTFLLDAPTETAHSMAWVNRRRLELQRRYDMADEHMVRLHERTETNIGATEETQKSHYDVIRAAREAIIFATLNHPVLRRSIFEAIVGVLWYLALLVPFVFFFEKLLFCYTDVRRQLIAQGAIFLVVFSLLRLLHPAFAMVRSSVMILLGFIIILVSAGISILFASKYQDNLADLRKARGKLKGAEVDTLGVIGSAFLLGLNNMHRRSLRTWLTCGTLSLLTFALICFTGVEDNIVDTEISIGKSAYTGILLNRPLKGAISETEEFAVRDYFGDRFDVCPRRFLVGKEFGPAKMRLNPQLKMNYEVKGRIRRADFDSIMQFTHREPLRYQIRFLTKNSWFTRDDEFGDSELLPIFIPDGMASILGISEVTIDNGDEVVVDIGGRRCRVSGIFDVLSLANLRALDGRDLLPFDIQSMETIVRTSRLSPEIGAGEEDPRISTQRIVLAPDRELYLEVANVENRTASIAVAIPQLLYREAREEITSFLEQREQGLYYGIGDVAYWGRRTRERSLADLIDLLVPLLLAGFTVLNTIKGSVYERRDEIMVYNAVGIAPRLVFFIFLTEAFVYVVVGSILGYVLSQGTGRVLTEFDLTGGINMTFTSLSTIYASLAVSGAVIISTWFPARTAMDIAAPAETSGWTLPEPEGDQLSFDLPFNFRSRERLAVLNFVNRYLLDHGEGSSGRFFAGVPEMDIDREETDPERAVIPMLSGMIWLRPFDLGVSQELTVILPTDEETGLFKARITIDRRSGTREAWLRLNHGFVALLRRHFLHWRAVSSEEREEMYEEAMEVMTERIGDRREMYLRSS